MPPQAGSNAPDLFGQGAGSSGPAPERVFRVTVFGRPQPKGSKHGFAIRKGQRKGADGKMHGGYYTGAVAMKEDTGAKGTDWLKHVKQIVGAVAQQQSWEALRGPVEITLRFYLVRPKGHFGTGRNAGVIKGSAAPYPITKPDFDKLTRAICDGMKGSVYADDSQVVDAVIRKRYGTPERVEIEAREMPPSDEPYSTELEF